MIKTILFRSDYYNTPSYMNTVADKICERYPDFQMRYGMLTGLDMQYVDIDSCYENLAFTKYEYSNIHKEHSYHFYYKNDWYDLLVIINRNFAACFFRLENFNDEISQEIIKQVQIIEYIIKNTNKVSFVSDSCKILKSEQIDLKQLFQLKSYSDIDIENFVSSEIVNIKNEDDFKLKIERILRNYSNEENSNEMKKLGYFIKSSVTTEEKTDWLKLFEKAEKELLKILK